MKRLVPAILVIMFLLSACGGSVATPYSLPPLATPAVGYQIVGSTKYTAMVVVDPQSNADRERLLYLGDYLCKEMQKCKVWFWDDIAKADTAYPVDADKQADLIAYYSFNYADWKGDLEVYTLGDPR